MPSCNAISSIVTLLSVRIMVLASNSKLHFQFVYYLSGQTSLFLKSPALLNVVTSLLVFDNVQSVGNTVSRFRTKLSSQLRPYFASGLFSRYFFQKNILQGPLKISLFNSEYNEAKQVNNLRISIAIENVSFFYHCIFSVSLSVFTLLLLFLSYLSFLF